MVWINGPFGGGNTQTAYELQRRLPGSVVCDPEHVGFGLHRMLPAALRGDFQDLVAWRRGVREVLELVLERHDGDVPVPMTVVEPTYLEEMIDGLAEHGYPVRHFALLAERENVLKRLRERGLGRVVQVVAGEHAALRREAFALAKLDHCLERLPSARFAEHLHTDRLTIAEVADRIAASAGLALTPGEPRPLRGRLARAWVSARHIRRD